MSKLLRKLKAVIAALAVAALLSGCAIADEPTQTPDPGETLAPKTPIAAQNLKEITLSIPAEEASIDPYEITSYKTQSLLNLVYETPIILDSSGFPQPYLFETWEVSSDGSVTFTVRRNVHFHGGERLDCSYIAENLRKIRLAGEQSPYAYVLDEVASWQLSEDDSQITIVPVNGVYQMLMALTFPVTGSDLSGTGPYSVAWFQQGDGMRLDRSDNWWRIAPGIETIHVTATGSDEEQIGSLVQGEIDLIYTRARNITAYKSSRKIKTVSVRSNVFEFISLNYSHFTNLRMKQAVIKAIDKMDIITSVYQGSAIAADTPIPADSWMHSATVNALEHDEAGALELLAAIGYLDRDGDGYLDTSAGDRTPLTLVLVTNSDTSSSLHRDAARRLEKQFKAVGILLDVRVLPMDELSEAIEAGDFDLAYLGCAVGADSNLDEFYSNGGNLNFAGYSSSAMDSLLSELKKAKTQQEFLTATAKIEKLAASDSPVIGICFRNNTLLHASSLSGIGAVTDANVYINIDEWVLEYDGSESIGFD